MGVHGMTVTEHVKMLVIPILDDLGLELFDVHYNKAGTRSILRVFIDKSGGVSIDDCQRASREIETILDVKEVVPGSYNLEVSSPGINRPLRNGADYVKYKGNKIKVKLASKIANQKTFFGVNCGIKEGVLNLEVTPGELIEIPVSKIVRANLIVDF
jgi:ribosome maturation factor RimP